MALIFFSKYLSPVLRAASVAAVLAAGYGSTVAQGSPERGIADALRSMYTDDVGEVRYFISWFDLNGDDRREAIAHLVGPRVCGTGGCDTYIFTRRGRGYKLISSIGLTRPRIVASKRRSHGWRNLIVYIAGGGILPGYYVELRFDGRAYPENPTIGPAKKVQGEPRGTVLIGKFESFMQGKPLIHTRRQSNNGLQRTRNMAAFSR